MTRQQALARLDEELGHVEEPSVPVRDYPTLEDTILMTSGIALMVAWVAVLVMVSFDPPHRFWGGRAHECAQEQESSK